MLAPFDVTDIFLETERLYLRPWKESDVQDLYEYASVDGVGECAGWKHHKSIEESRCILSLFMREKKTFAIVLKSNGKVIGSLGMEELSVDPVEGECYGREIGYVLGKPYWGQGLATEAVKKVISYCFDTLSYDYLTVGHFVGNDRSRRVIEKNGFTCVQNIQYKSQMGTVENEKLYLLENPQK